MAKKTPQSQDKKIISHSFNIPEGLSSLTHGNLPEEVEEEENSLLVDDSDQVLLDNTFTVTVVEQTLRSSNDGALTVLVDVILEVDDVTGADNYDVRVAISE